MAEEQGVEREQKGPLASCPQGAADAGGGKAGLQVVPLPGALGPAPSAAGIRQVSEIGS